MVCESKGNSKHTYVQPKGLTRTQKRGLQRTKAVNKMKQTLAMIADLKVRGQAKTSLSQVVFALGHAFGNHSLVTTEISTGLAKCMPTKLIETNKDKIIPEKKNHFILLYS